MSVENQLIDVEMRIAYQEDLLADLNQIVARQDAEILTLKQQLILLAKRVDDLLAQTGRSVVDLGDEKPPYY